MSTSGTGVPDVPRTDSVASFPTNSFDYYRDSSRGEASRRTFAYLVAGGVGVGLVSGAKSSVLDFLSTMSASADVLALANVEVDLTTIPVGANMTVKWRGKPLFIRHRSAEEVEEVRKVPVASLRDQEADEARVKQSEWLVVLGVCTHLGCVPLANAGDYNGYFCPCHGSHYDTSARIRKGPAPLNLEVPPYKFVSDSLLLVGEE